MWASVTGKMAWAVSRRSVASGTPTGVALVGARGAMWANCVALRVRSADPNDGWKL